MTAAGRPAHDQPVPPWAGLACVLAAAAGACSLGGPLPPREVRGPAADPAAPAVPEIPGRIIVAEHAGRGGHLLFVDEAGRRLRSLTEPPSDEASFDITPAWSPDGHFVAYSSSRGSPGRAAGLWIRRADGSAPPRRL